MFKGKDGTPVVTGREARQGRRTGVYRILIVSLALAVSAGVGMAVYFGTLS